MDSPRVSVVMSVYGDRGALRQSIDSVLEQSFESLEFIIVDDASPDGALETLRAVQNTDPRVKIIGNDVNLGLTKSLNRGLDLARGEFIARIDEGDVWLPGKLEQQVAFLENSRSHVLVGSRYINHLPDGPAPGLATRLPLCDRDMRTWLFCGLTPVTHPAILFRNGIIKYNPGAATSQDFELCLRLSLVGKICNVPSELVSVLRPPDAISVRKQDAQFFDHYRMHLQFLDVLRGRIDEQRFVEEGVDFGVAPRSLELRRKYMAFWFGMLCGVRNQQCRAILKNLLVPDVFLYLVRKRSAPYRLRHHYNAWLSRY